MPKVRSSRYFTLPSISCQKLGQPVPDFELLVGFEKRQVAAGAGERALAMLLEERARPGILRPFLAQHVELLGRQDSAPFLLGLRHLEDFRRVLAARAARCRAWRRRRQAPPRQSRKAGTDASSSWALPCHSPRLALASQPVWSICSSSYAAAHPRVSRHRSSIRGETRRPLHRASTAGQVGTEAGLGRHQHFLLPSYASNHLGDVRAEPHLRGFSAD